METISLPQLKTCIGMYKVWHNYLDTTIAANTVTVLYSPCKLVLVLAVFLPSALGNRVGGTGTAEACGGPARRVMTVKLIGCWDFLKTELNSTLVEAIENIKKNLDRWLDEPSVTYI